MHAPRLPTAPADARRRQDLSRAAHRSLCSLFFFNDTATTEIYTLSLHDALPILGTYRALNDVALRDAIAEGDIIGPRDRKSTRLNSSHLVISYAVFCLKKKTASIPIRMHHPARGSIAGACTSPSTLSSPHHSIRY